MQTNSKTQLRHADMALAGGELLILLDRTTRWTDAQQILSCCARDGIWQLAFVVQRDRRVRIKIPERLPADGQ